MFSPRAADHEFRFAKRNILLEGFFGGYRLCGSVRDDLAIIDPTSEFVETYAKAPEAALHGWQFDRALFSGRRYGECLELCFHHLSNARQSADGKW
jgi:hypothetical protein